MQKSAGKFFRDSRAQSTIEFISVLSLLILVFIVILGLVYQKQADTVEFRDFIEAKRICMSLAATINTVSEQGDGYYVYYTFPEKINGYHNFTLAANGPILEIFWSDKSFWTAPITPEARIICMEKGPDAKNRIVNRHGYVYIICPGVDLEPLGYTVSPLQVKGGSSMTMSIDVENAGDEDTNATFNVIFTLINHITGMNDVETTSISGLDAQQVKPASVNMSAPSNQSSYLVIIDVDNTNVVNESDETNNQYNYSLTVF